LVFKEHLHKKMTTLQGWNLKCDPKMTHTLHLTITQNGHISMHFDLLKSDWSTKLKVTAADHVISLLPSYLKHINIHRIMTFSLQVKNWTKFSSFIQTFDCKVNIAF
jgi:hypothetical protein